ncbi:hypothetical protein GOB57_24910 [Sinorhizobium meliloti]|nr:hypothetical protein [Sinorhizobium meliloti]
MAISRRELEFLVDRELHALDIGTLVKVAETVLGKTVTVRGNRFSFRPLAPADNDETMAEFPAGDKALDLCPSPGNTSLPAKAIAQAIHAERQRFGKVLEAAERTVTAFDTRGRVAYAVTALEAALREHGLYHPWVQGEVASSAIAAVTRMLGENEGLDQTMDQKRTQPEDRRPNQP